MYPEVGLRPYSYLSLKPSTVPLAPIRKWWSITLFPSSPLLLPNPSGQMSVAEFMSTHDEFSADAHTKTIFALNSMVWFVSASRICTPLAFLLSLSYSICVTFEYGRNVRLPVFIAARKVDDCVLKYPPNGQPLQQRFRY